MAISFLNQRRLEHRVKPRCPPFAFIISSSTSSAPILLDWSMQISTSNYITYVLTTRMMISPPNQRRSEQRLKPRCPHFALVSCSSTSSASILPNWREINSIKLGLVVVLSTEHQDRGIFFCFGYKVMSLMQESIKYFFAYHVSPLP